jgi:hypothetical protein
MQVLLRQPQATLCSNFSFGSKICSSQPLAISLADALSSEMECKGMKGKAIGK